MARVKLRPRADHPWRFQAPTRAQFSELKGGFEDKAFKLPNPNYFLP